MSSIQTECAKCKGVMEPGFVIDRSLAATSLPLWVEGEAAQEGAEPGSLVGKRMRRIARADRCKECGYLEFYTGNEIVWG